MRDIKFKYIYKGFPFSSTNKGFNWHTKIFSLIDIESGVIRLSNIEEHLGELVARVQFTGLQDANGVDIYEGDVVDLLGDGEYLCAIGWNAKTCAFCAIDHDRSELDSERLSDHFYGGELSRVIGNIHQNQELIAKGE